MFLGSISRLRGFRVTVSKKRKKLITSRGVFVPNFRSVSYFFWSGGGDQVKDTQNRQTHFYTREIEISSTIYSSPVDFN